MREFGLVGYPLGHSFSKKYFEELFLREGLVDCVFSNFEISDINDIEEIISTHTNLLGFGVTIPHKENILPFLTDIDPLARRVGAVNCVKLIREQYSIKKIGYNSDVIGFRLSLTGFVGEQRPKALVLGSGGASKAVRVALDDMGIEYTLVSRSSALRYNQIDKKVIENHLLIINTTPLGMFPNISTAPELPYEYVTNKHFAFDLVYNPQQTMFMTLCEERGAKSICGFDMLANQAEAAWIIYNK